MTILALFAAAAVAFPAGARGGVPLDSVVHDSIYKLAVNPADFPKESFVYLLDEGVYRMEPGGRWSRTFRQVIQILKPQGALRYREQRFSYSPDREKLTINWMRVLKPDGTVISGAPEQVQESDVPASMEIPTYTSTKIRRLSLSGLDSGTVLDYSVTTDEVTPPMPGDFYHSWRVTPGSPVRRSLLLIDVPAGYSPRIQEKNLNFTRTQRTVAGRTLYTWATDEVPIVKSEPFAPDSAVKVMTVSVSPSYGWDAIGKWYSPIAASRYAVTQSVAEKVKALTAASRSLDDSISAIHKWVSTDIRYVAISLGQGGYVPRDAETVSRTGFGDCKDKTMLFLAALKSMGVTGYPVLLNATAKVNEAAPSLAQFNHMIAAVQTSRGLRYSDLTVSDIPFGDVIPQENGKFGVVVRDGTGKEVHLPGTAPLLRKDDIRIAGALTTDGVFNGTLEERMSGGDFLLMRLASGRAEDSVTRGMLTRSMASSMFEGADGDSLVIAKAPDESGEMIVRIRVRNAKATTDVSTLALLANPIRPFIVPPRLISDLEKQTARTMPIDLSRLVPASPRTASANILLPAGWHAVLPKNASYSGLLGNFEITFAQVGNEIQISRKIAGARNALGPERLQDVIAELKRISTDNARTIPIQKQ